MSYQYWDAQGNNYVRPWGNDFTEEERKERGIGEFREEVDPSRITQGKFQMPELGNRIEDFLSTLPRDPGIMDGPPPGRGWPEGGTTLGPGYEGTYTDGTPLTPPMQTPPAEVPTPPLEKTLEQQVWERGQMPKRTPDAQGRLYPDKNDPGFLDPRVQGDGRMTMQYIPELDDPNWTPWKNYGPGWSREQDWNKGGEGVQYRR